MSKPKEPAGEQLICPSSGRCPPGLRYHPCEHRGKHDCRGTCSRPCWPVQDWKATEPWCGPCQPYVPQPVTVPPVLAGRAEAEGGR